MEWAAAYIDNWTIFNYKKQLISGNIMQYLLDYMAMSQHSMGTYG